MNNNTKFIYAVNKEGKLQHIDKVANGLQCECFCPYCHHEPLVAKNNGKIKDHHFSHASGNACDYAYESMLHLLAKEKIQGAFLKVVSFKIAFTFYEICSKKQKCIFTKFEGQYDPNDCMKKR